MTVVYLYIYICIHYYHYMIQPYNWTSKSPSPLHSGAILHPRGLAPRRTPQFRAPRARQRLPPAQPVASALHAVRPHRGGGRVQAQRWCSVMMGWDHGDFMGGFPWETGDSWVMSCNLADWKDENGMKSDHLTIAMWVEASFTRGGWSCLH